MTFFEIKASLTREKFNKHKGCKSILKCYYDDTVYFFGINIPEPVVTDEMLRDGKWFIYNWTDGYMNKRINFSLVTNDLFARH